ncbi:MAG: IgA Peptidase M64 [Bacteroidales bacterium]|nr:IgA Peptidase M64 [Bacteroidales bacterium]
MRKCLITLLALLPLMTTAQFDRYFTEASLRVDYCLTGNRSATTFSLKELIREPYWSGSKTNLIDSLEFGNYIVKAFETETGKLLFSKGYQNLYGEWQTTLEALALTKSFEESVIVPFPKVKIDIAMYYKTWEGELTEGMRFTVNPDDYFIRDYDNLNLPIYEAWIGNQDITKAVDIVILSEGYTQAEMGKFIKDCDFFVKSLFSYAPYDRYRESFNVRGVMAPSAESGCTMPGDHIYKNTVMHFSFWTFDSERYCMSTYNRDIRDLAGQVPYDQIYILVNTEKYGGGGIYNFYCSSASSNSRSSDVIIHEFGHGFAGLADEYYYAGSSEHMYNLALEPWEPNLTTLVDFSGKWGDMVDKETPIPTPREPRYEQTIGVFKGGGYETEGMYSPHMDCLMKSFKGHEFCPVCQHAIERMILYYSK